MPLIPEPIRRGIARLLPFGKAAPGGRTPLVGTNALGGTLRPKDPAMGGGSYGVVPTFNRSMTFADLGTTGLRAFSGWVREEFLPQLVGRQAARVYREMSDNDPTIGAITSAINGIMRRVDWRVNPVDDTPQAQEMAEFADSLRFDMSETWEDFVVEMLSMLRFGYAPHEIVYKRRLGHQKQSAPNSIEGQDVLLPSSKFDDGRIGWRRLPLRGQDTILKWFFGPNGEILGVTQQPWIGPLVDIPIEKMMLFRGDMHKNNPEGRSILRNCYVPYYFIKRLQEQEAILYERLSGFPVMEVPDELLQAAASGDPIAMQQLDTYKQLITNVRIDEQMGALIPSDTYKTATGASAVRMYNFRLETPQSGRQNMDANTPIVRYKNDMMTSILADFLSMGHTTRGAQNLAETKVDLFMGSVEGWLKSAASVINRHGLPRLWDLNGLDPALMPEVVPDMAQRIDLDALSNFVLRMSQAGMPLFPDPDLEEYIRDTAGLPDIGEDTGYMQSMAESSGDEADVTTKKRHELKAAISTALARRVWKNGKRPAFAP